MVDEVLVLLDVSLGEFSVAGKSPGVVGILGSRTAQKQGSFRLFWPVRRVQDRSCDLQDWSCVSQILGSVLPKLVGPVL